jgi:acyl-coenzyme A synthetase/AMP-(fatty) acid ligase
MGKKRVFRKRIKKWVRTMGIKNGLMKKMGLNHGFGLLRTGDTAEADQKGCWKILGRTSTDIIKSGGYKISALQIEDALLAHPLVAHCAVVGIPDEALGETITAIISCDAEEVPPPFSRSPYTLGETITAIKFCDAEEVPTLLLPECVHPG